MSRNNKPHLPAVPPGGNLPVPRSRGRTEVAFLRSATHYLDTIASKLLPYDAGNQLAPDQRARPTILIGLTLMIVLFGIVGLWAALVPLKSGAIAPGRVMSESSRKEIQHLEGGIIKEILVKDGDTVKAGQVLVRLDATNAKAKSDQVLGQYLAAKASESRLIAERDGKPTITFPDEYVKQESLNAKVKDALETQRHLFTTRRDALEGQISVLNEKIGQSGEEIRGLKEQIAADNTQIELLNQEIATVQGLLASGNALKPRLLALQRQQADLMGRRGESQSQISRAMQAANESKINILNIKNDFMNKVAGELKDTQVQLSSLEEQARSTTDIARRVEVTAPSAGIITGLAVHTIGGVVGAGEVMMYLIPTDDRLIIEAHVSPQDVDAVHAGLIAQVRLTAFKSRYLHPVQGKVITVSADRVDDKNVAAESGQSSYYIARVEIPESELAALGKNIKLTSGMPADVLIVTGTRTMLSYIMRPIRESFGHAFHDQ